MSDRLSPLCRELIELADGLRGPFPSGEVKIIRQLTGLPIDEFIPDFSSFVSVVYSSSRWIRELLDGPREAMVRRQAYLDKSFLDWFPQHTTLVAAVSKEEAPKLYGELELSEKMRIMLVEAIDLRLSELP